MVFTFSFLLRERETESVKEILGERGGAIIMRVIKMAHRVHGTAICVRN